MDAEADVARLAGAGQLRPGLRVLAGLHCSAHSASAGPTAQHHQLHGQMDAAAICGDDVIRRHGTLLYLVYLNINHTLFNIINIAMP